MRSRSSRFCSAALLAVCSLTASAGLAVEPPSSDDAQAPVMPPALKVGQTTWYVGGAEPVAPSLVAEGPAFSRDGNSLVVLQARHSPLAQIESGHEDCDYSVISWDRFRRRPRTLWHYRALAGESPWARGITWMRDSRHVALLVMHSYPKPEDSAKSWNELVILDTLKETARSIVMPGLTNGALMPSPDQDVLAIVINDLALAGHQAEIHILDCYGNTRSTFPLTNVGHDSPTLMVDAWWSQRPGILSASCLKPVLNGPSEVTFLRVDTATGVRTTVEESEAAGILEVGDIWALPPGPAGLQAVTAPLSPSGSESLPGAFLTSTSPNSSKPVLIAGDAQAVRVIGDVNGHDAGILYLTRGALLFAPLVRMDAAAQ